MASERASPASEMASPAPERMSPAPERISRGRESEFSSEREERKRWERSLRVRVLGFGKEREEGEFGENEESNGNGFLGFVERREE